jgi:hypothetical protein
MASTIARASLTVTVKEDLTLDGIQLGKDTAYVIPNIDKWVSRVIPVPNTNDGIVLFTLFNEPSFGQYDVQDFKYLRITVKDDTVGINLYIKDATASEGFTVKIAPGTSWILHDENFTMGIAASPPAPTFLPMFSFLAVRDGAAATTVEFVVGLAS